MTITSKSPTIANWDQMKSLDGASQIELGFRQSIYEREMVRGVRYGGMWDRLVVDGGMLAQ